MIIIIIGPPGSGKGTHAELIAKNFGFERISMGDAMRQEVQNDTELGNKIKDTLSAGELVDDEIVMEVFKKEYDKVKDGVVIDGIPRTLAQAQKLDKFLSDKGTQVDIVFMIDVDDDTIIKRITGRRVCLNCGTIYNLNFKPPLRQGVCDVCGGEIIQREDDNEEITRKRIDIYRKTAGEIEKYYDDKDILVDIDGNDDADKIYKKIAELISDIYDYKKKIYPKWVDEEIKKLTETDKEARRSFLREAAEVEVTMPFLKELLRRGYDTVTFIANKGCCNRCKVLNRRRWDLKRFISQAKYEAPIYTVSHPGCCCYIKVTDKKGKLEPVVLDYSGEVEDVR